MLLSVTPLHSPSSQRTTLSPNRLSKTHANPWPMVSTLACKYLSHIYCVIVANVCSIASLSLTITKLTCPPLNSPSKTPTLSGHTASRLPTANKEWSLLSTLATTLLHSKQLLPVVPTPVPPTLPLHPLQLQLHPPLLLHPPATAQTTSSSLAVPTSSSTPHPTSPPTSVTPSPSNSK